MTSSSGSRTKAWKSRRRTPAELGKLNAEQYAKWTKVIRQAGIKTE